MFCGKHIYFYLLVFFYPFPTMSLCKYALPDDALIDEPHIICIDHIRLAAFWHFCQRQYLCITIFLTTIFTETDVGTQMVDGMFPWSWNHWPGPSQAIQRSPNNLSLFQHPPHTTECFVDIYIYIFIYFLTSPGNQLFTAHMHISIVQCTLSISSPINYSHIDSNMSCIVGHQQYRLELSSDAAHVIHFNRVSECSPFLHFTFSDSTNARNSCFHPAGEDEPSNPQASPQILCCDPTKPAKCSSFYQQLFPSTYLKRN